MISSSVTAAETALTPAPETVTAMGTETERAKEVDDEEEKIRRQKKLEEALEAKSLRRIISAYLKYLFIFSLFDFFVYSSFFRVLYIFRRHSVGGIK